MTFFKSLRRIGYQFAVAFILALVHGGTDVVPGSWGRSSLAMPDNGLRPSPFLCNRGSLRGIQFTESGGLSTYPAF
jgi:hypothetical protein